MDSPQPLFDAFDALARGKRVQLRFEGSVSDDVYRPAKPFETEVEWVHSWRDETETTITYRAEFTPLRMIRTLTYTILEKQVPEEGGPEVTALIAESNEEGDRITWQIAAIESLELVD